MNSDDPKRKNPNPWFYTDDKAKFLQHIFAQADILTNHNTKPKQRTKSLNTDANPFNFLSSSAEDRQTNTNTENTQSNFNSGFSAINKPRIWVKRLRGNRIQVKWDTSPINPHLMNYCIVLNTKRDFSSLCSATGERFGVLPPDLMHVAYYGSSSESNIGTMFDSSYSPYFEEKYYVNDQGISRRIRHSSRIGPGSRKKTRAAQEDLVIGCVNKKTDYILSNLHSGRLYYFNVFIRDASTNVSYPYLRTTLKYELRKVIHVYVVI